jgi:hypothetical protein
MEKMREIEKFLESNENENTTLSEPVGHSKDQGKWKFITISV